MIKAPIINGQNYTLYCFHLLGNRREMIIAGMERQDEFEFSLIRPVRIQAVIDQSVGKLSLNMAPFCYMYPDPKTAPEKVILRKEGVDSYYEMNGSDSNVKLMIQQYFQTFSSIIMPNTKL